MTRCRATRADGEPCEALSHMVGGDGWCHAHRPGVDMSERGAKGGRATREAWSRPGLSMDALGSLESLEDAQRWLRTIAAGVVSAELDKGDAQAATKAVAEWVKTEAAVLTKHLVGELQRELAEKAQEIDQLRTELARARVRPA